MRKLSLDEIWDYTKRMWKWIAFQVEVLKDERSVTELKKVWLKENEPEFTRMISDCFFCQNHDECCCDTTCPGSLVEKGFSCCASAHHYENKPGAFYREILRLNAIRTAELPVVELPVVEHEWVHGDVFRNGSGYMMYLNLGYGEDSMVWIDRKLVVSCTITEYRRDCTFLFNIADALSDRGIA